MLSILPSLFPLFPILTPHLPNLWHLRSLIGKKLHGQYWFCALEWVSPCIKYLSTLTHLHRNALTAKVTGVWERSWSECLHCQIWNKNIQWNVMEGSFYQMTKMNRCNGKKCKIIISSSKYSWLVIFKQSIITSNWIESKRKLCIL